MHTSRFHFTLTRMTAQNGSTPIPSDQVTLVGVVAIGRNEGERLKRCLASVSSSGVQVVYVDSGSSDGSVEWARSIGVEVVALDMSIPFTAARARNAGFSRLHEDVTLVQFVDGDCELVPGWLRLASEFLDRRPDVSCVCGRLRERFPERSIYNRLCDMEWNRAPGETDACGGIAMYRSEQFRAAGGFREALIAGEEPELCLRIRARGGRIWRVADEMAWHDADMTRFRQWWRRAVRGGHALAEGMSLHRAASSDPDKARLRRVVGWGMAWPTLVLAISVVHPAWLILLGSYPLRVVRLATKSAESQQSPHWLWATFMVLSSFPEALGVAKYWLNRRFGRHSALIEYK